MNGANRLAGNPLLYPFQYALLHRHSETGGRGSGLMRSTTITKGPSSLDSWIMGAFGVVFFGGCIPIAAHYVGVSYVPSESVSNASHIVAYIVAGFAAIVMFCLLVFSDRIDRQREKQGKAKPSVLLKILIALGFSPIAGMFGYMLVVGTWPMTLATIAGSKAQLPFTVAEVSTYGSRGCRDKVSFSGLPLLLDSICNVPNEQMEKLKPGARIVMIGRGTSQGLFYSDMIISDWPLR